MLTKRGIPLPTTIEELAEFEKRTLKERDCGDALVWVGKSFNWITALAMLTNGASQLEEDAEAMKDLASSWPTCACGQLCRQLPKQIDGSPADGTLAILGGEFAEEIDLREWDSALAVFKQIEARTTRLLNETAQDKTS